MQPAPPLHAPPAPPPTPHVPDFDAPINLELEKQLQERREHAYTAPLLWQGRQLQPWSLLRHAMHRRLMQHLSPVPQNLWGADLEAHAPDAMLFLWLAHQPEMLILQLAAQPVALWLSVFTWAETHLQRDLWTAALALMTETFDLGKITEVRVREAAGQNHAGEPQPPSPAPRRPSSPFSAPRATAPRKKSAGAGRSRK